VPLDGAIAELAGAAGTAGPTVDTAWALLVAVRARMTYERGSTDVHTRADEALADGRGVCQDFAHVLIGACRARGIPARYVSGYLYSPEAEETASHGWADVFVDDRWVSLDPTHDRMQTDHYVRVAVGRDYGDVPPTRGVYLGTGSETLEVDVRIAAGG
jgi:transglutaminase-like putative cysteine protease